MRGHIYLAIELFLGSWFTLIALGTAWGLWPKGEHAKRPWPLPQDHAVVVVDWPLDWEELGWA